MHLCMFVYVYVGSCGKRRNPLRTPTRSTLWERSADIYIYIYIYIYQSEGGNGCNECPGRDRDMDLCWEGVVVQT